jgi:carbamoyl-phosphate synthase large subunit
VNVLFTSVGRRVELVRAFKQAYKDLDLEGSVVATDVDRLAPALRESDRPYLVPSLSDPSYLDVVSEIVRSEEIDLVFPLIDPDVPVLAGGRARLEAAGARVVVIPEESVRSTSDKLLTHELFIGLGIPVPRTWSAAEVLDERPVFPLFVKPRFGSAGQHCVRVQNVRELTFFLEYVPDPIVQEFLVGPEITTDVLCDLNAGGKVLAAVSRRRIEVRQGEVAKGVTILDPAILAHCVAIAQQLEAIGPITVQCIMRDDGASCFTEVNPRFGGGVPLGIAAGVRSAHWLLASACGQQFELPRLGAYEIGLYVTRFDTSHFLTEGSFRGDPKFLVEGDRS